MTAEANIEIVTPDALLEKVRALRDQGYRLVQIGAARLPESMELTYSFDLENRLANLRLNLPLDQPRLPSISSIYKCVLLYENEIHDLFGIQVDGMAVDFHGNLYKTAIKHPFATLKAPRVTAAAEPKPSGPPKSAGPPKPATT
ncbi:MAG: NADH-quinone oxidoreductase subunit C [Tepidisphaeraceae bacterium]|jgi:ech hydrogenase subunit D